MTRLKLPAYGKRLLEERRAGKHPLEVTLVYGDRWSKGKDPRVCISPEEYAPAQYDFCMLAGTRVLVLDQLNAGADWNGKFYDLLHELAIAGALVIVETPDGVRSSVLQLADRERKRSTDG